MAGRNGAQAKIEAKMVQDIARVPDPDARLPLGDRRESYPKAPSIVTPAGSERGSSATTYKVKDGQTFWSIARELKIPLNVLMSLNPKIDPTKLGEGTVIVVKAPSGGVDRTKKPESDATRSGRSQDVKPAPEDGPKVTAGDLNARISARIASIRSAGNLLTPAESTSWMVYDLKSRSQLAGINADTPRAFASMVKVFVAVAFFHEVEAGHLTYGPESKKKLEAMLRHSDNSATNWFIDRIGGAQKVESILKGNFPKFTGTLDIVQKIPAGGSEYSNTCTARDCALILEAIYDRKCSGAAEIHKVMDLSSNDRLVDKTGGRLPSDVNVMHKTGSTAKFIGDMGILTYKDRDGGSYPVIVVGMVSRSTRDADYGRFMKRAGDTIREVSVETYRHLKAAGKVR